MDYQEGGIPSPAKARMDRYSPEEDRRVALAMRESDSPRRFKNSPVWNLASPAMRSLLSRIYRLD